MGSSVKRLTRDRLVNDASIRAFFTGVSTTATASLFVSPVFMESTGLYPRITYSEILGPTVPGLSASDGLVTFSVEVQATGGSNPHITQENVCERIEQLFDDQVVTGLAISGTSVYACLFLREGGTEAIFNSERKTYQKFVNYSYRMLKY